MSDRAFKTHVCKGGVVRTFTFAEWKMLEKPSGRGKTGMYTCDETGKYFTEMRNCSYCDTTLAVETKTGEAVVHVLRHGLALCLFEMRLPGEWPFGHTWVRETEKEQANCEACLKAPLI